MLDVLIKNAYVINGTGNRRFKADIGIEEPRIVKIGDLKSEKAVQIIDASGLVASPGFIDMHSHSDFTLLINPKAESKIRQGITTEVIGNCGTSAAPLNKAIKEEIRRTMSILEEVGARDKAAYAEPHEYPEGIEYVLVNGEMAVERNTQKETLSGKALRKHS